MEYIPLEACPPQVYEGLGLMSGLEIHQQLFTEKKLFCRCPAGRYSKHWDARILRHMRPTLSELGEYDGTALMEFKTKKEITYLINKETVCTYEFDDTPPFQINDQAVDIALEVTLLLNCNMVSEFHIARKQYLDGSIPAGFQRTTILGTDGWIPYAGRRIGIRQLGLEEDSCREVSDIGHQRTYVTDRLGMPLIETVTYPDMKTPQEAAEVAHRLRRLVRATRHVRTGAGAGREDVNVSVRGGNRCEIKGVSSIKRIPLLVHNEAFRQAALLEIRASLLSRGLKPETFAPRDADLTSRLQKTRFVPIRQALDAGKRVAGVLLPVFEGILSRPLTPGRRFMAEFSDRVRVIACIDEQPNIIVSDLPDGTLSPDSWLTARKALGAGTQDAVVLVWGAVEDVRTAVAEIGARAREALVGVPLETRQALPDGNTGFERILPGPERMYPDTDLPPKAVLDAQVDAIRARLPDQPWAREERYLKAGLAPELAFRLSVSPFAPLYDQLAPLGGVRPSCLASLLVDHLRSLKRRGLDLTRLQDAFLSSAFGLLARGKIMWGGVLALIEFSLGGVQGAPEELVDCFQLQPASEDDIRKGLEDTLHELKGRRFPSREDQVRYAMGHFMGRLGRRVDGAEIRRRLSEAVASDRILKETAA
ncbi:MAG: glutamyl-tRNA(Gln) amidotransferase subunit E [Elusimicrobia bacterium GWA2_69_24]|nr:MAG: glutamyl-tRNA(Gln) amidotransferase subunit E [Elusimicrobia bacterium GWA2_69_24]HBL17569.1 Glu-tRNA(Gln) amidotransferase GatDE subunit E [Elusimicrobiota bacterium]